MYFCVKKDDKWCRSQSAVFWILSLNWTWCWERKHGRVIIIDVQVQQLQESKEKAFTVCWFSTVGKKNTYNSQDESQDTLHSEDKIFFSLDAFTEYVKIDSRDISINRLRMEVDTGVQRKPFIIFTWLGTDLAKLVNPVLSVHNNDCNMTWQYGEI